MAKLLSSPNAIFREPRFQQKFSLKGTRLCCCLDSVCFQIGGLGQRRKRPHRLTSIPILLTLFLLIFSQIEIFLRSRVTAYGESAGTSPPMTFSRNLRLFPNAEALPLITGNASSQRPFFLIPLESVNMDNRMLAL